MSHWPRPALFLLAVLGCGNLLAKDPAPSAEAAPTPAPAEPAPGPAAAPSEPARFGVPFAWETSPNEPLARARGFIAEMLTANDQLAALGPKRFAALSADETPRATVVSCADSRVQSSAWDATPENDNFTIRNLGNQIEGALGSIEYGVRQLHTPVLLVVGHTGCDAVKAALDKPENLAAPIRNELARLEVPTERAASPESTWTAAVSANVHAQVAQAVKHFGPLVHSGDLTVLGAVYDLKNELGRGAGRLHVIDVNTNTDAERIDAFVKAVRAAGTRGGKGDERGAVQQRIQAIIERTERSLPRATRAAH